MLIIMVFLVIYLMYLPKWKVIVKAGFLTMYKMIKNSLYKSMQIILLTKYILIKKKLIVLIVLFKNTFSQVIQNKIL